MASYCAKILRPLKTSLQKKKKKKKDTNTAQVQSPLFTPQIHPCIIYQTQYSAPDNVNWSILIKCNSTDIVCLLQPLVVCGFQELSGSLQDLLAEALEHIKGQETGITALKLASLTLEGYKQVSEQMWVPFFAPILFFTNSV